MPCFNRDRTLLCNRTRRHAATFYTFSAALSHLVEGIARHSTTADFLD